MATHSAASNGKLVDLAVIGLTLFFLLSSALKSEQVYALSDEHKEALRRTKSLGRDRHLPAAAVLWSVRLFAHQRRKPPESGPAAEQKSDVASNQQRVVCADVSGPADMLLVSVRPAIPVFHAHQVLDFDLVHSRRVHHVCRIQVCSELGTN